MRRPAPSARTPSRPDRGRSPCSPSPRPRRATRPWWSAGTRTTGSSGRFSSSGQRRAAGPSKTIGRPQGGAESILDNTLDDNPVSYAVLSPDGARLSLVLLPDAADDVAQQRTEVVVLDTATGGLVRQGEVTGLVLGQALTNDALAIQTAQALFPGGAGRGLINVFPLNDPTAPASSFPSGQWLAGAGRTSLLLSPRSMSLGNQTRSGIPVTLTAVDVREAESVIRSTSSLSRIVRT